MMKKLRLILLFILLLLISGCRKQVVLDPKAHFVKDLYSSSSQEPESSRPLYVEEGTVHPPFSELLRQNDDTAGWITIENTQTDYPVVLGEDNDYYLDHDFDGNSSKEGTLFLDFRSSIEEGNTSKNLIIYGHNMKSGSMFGELTNYKKLDFYKENPTFKFDTLYEKATWKIFSTFIVNADPQYGNAFYYIIPDFNSSEEFMEFIEECKARSSYNYPVDVNEDDQIVTLSTCTYEIEDGRFVVMARRVRENENPNVDVSVAEKNENAVGPKE